jgi:hypothetical protein
MSRIGERIGAQLGSNYWYLVESFAFGLWGLGSGGRAPPS